jgi:hypothetical protein
MLMNTKSHIKRRGVWYLILLVLASVILPCARASGQPIAVQLLNGKTRKPLKGYRVYILLGDPRAQNRLDLKTDHEGKVHFEASSENTFQVRPVGTVACTKPTAASEDINFNVAEVIAHGVVTPNECGSFDPEPMRGQVTFLTRSASGMDLFRN